MTTEGSPAHRVSDIVRKCEAAEGASVTLSGDDIAALVRWHGEVAGLLTVLTAAGTQAVGLL